MGAMWRRSLVGDVLRDAWGVLPTGRNTYARSLPDAIQKAFSSGAARSPSNVSSTSTALRTGGAYPETVAVTMWGFGRDKD